MPQQTIMLLAQQTIEGMKDAQTRETLQAIQYGTRMVQLLI